MSTKSAVHHIGDKLQALKDDGTISNAAFRLCCGLDVCRPKWRNFIFECLIDRELITEEEYGLFILTEAEL